LLILLNLQSLTLSTPIDAVLQRLHILAGLPFELIGKFI